jgi:hypothetical protein
MRKAGKALFQSLGALRDTHVLAEWIDKLFTPDDPAAWHLLAVLKAREEQCKQLATSALQDFDRTRWEELANVLSPRLATLPPDGPLFAHLALERWCEARNLHHRALRNRTNLAFHDLRIGVKRLRYTVENFLPHLYEFWAADLKEMQDALGDVHDLDVLWSTSLASGSFPDSESRERWRAQIRERRRRRLTSYRDKMVGQGSLWQVWRSALPKSDQLRTLGRQRLELWAHFLDPDTQHSRHVLQLALQMFDGMSHLLKSDEHSIYRDMLHAAALMHEVGRAKTSKGPHKQSARMIRNLSAPLGWSSDEVAVLALLSRYHRGALPGESQVRFSRLSKTKQNMVRFLGGILRLACACDIEHDSHIKRLEVEATDSLVTLRAQGYAPGDSIAQHLASARYLLEIASNRPVFIAPADVGLHRTVFSN